MEDDAAKGEKWIFLSSKDGDLVDRAATVAIFEKHRPTCPSSKGVLAMAEACDSPRRQCLESLKRLESTSGLRSWWALSQHGEEGGVLPGEHLDQ